MLQILVKQIRFKLTWQLASILCFLYFFGKRLLLGIPNSCKVEILVPVPLLFQVEIVKNCRDLGLGPGGFYQPGFQGGGKLHLQMMCLGLNWDPQTRKYEDRRHFDGCEPPHIPHEFSLLVKRAILDAHALVKKECRVSNVEDILPSMSPNICIVNFYTTSGKLGLHQVITELPCVRLNSLFEIYFLFTS
jgi:hypothetical protein